jgi:cytochrome c oxidase subunit 3
MSVEVAEAHGHHHDPHLQHQFQDMDQQNESYVVGMWTFLVTEIMFFGALFLAYTVYRRDNPAVFLEVHHHLNVFMGATNTMVLLTSSLTMAMAVYHAQMKNRRMQMMFLGITILFSFCFLVIKGFEWREKFRDNHVPGPSFQYKIEPNEGHGASAKRQPERTTPVPVTHLSGDTKVDFPKDTMQPDYAAKAQLFFSLYFAMTGLHAFHVIIGILVMGALFFMLMFKHPSVDYYMPVEMAGLYWHFVDIVWIFLFPLFYLIPSS